jgi:hypothetical protein
VLPAPSPPQAEKRHGLQGLLRSYSAITLEAIWEAIRKLRWKLFGKLFGNPLGKLFAKLFCDYLGSYKEIKLEAIWEAIRKLFGRYFASALSGHRCTDTQGVAQQPNFAANAPRQGIFNHVHATVLENGDCRPHVRSVFGSYLGSHLRSCGVHHRLRSAMGCTDN